MVFKTFSFYAMSDIHGNYDAFDRALRFVESHATLVLLGDYLDGGRLLDKFWRSYFNWTLIQL